MPREAPVMRAVPFDDELLTNAILFIVSPFFLGSCWSCSARDSLWAVVLRQSAFCLPPSPRPRRRVRLYLVQKVRRLPQILPRVESWQTIHLRRGNVERPVLPQRRRIRPDPMPLLTPPLQRRLENFRPSLPQT